MKKIDWYILRIFLGPFIAIFNILLFIFIVQLFWQKMADFTGKGIGIWVILKLLFFLGLSTVRMVLPLAILLSAIMTYGTLGERYEMAAIKASGMSLWRAMRSVLIFSCLMMICSYYFSDRIIPNAIRKGKNILWNIIDAQPQLHFPSGAFINNIPGYAIRIGTKTGLEKRNLEDLVVFKSDGFFNDQQTIRAKRGLLEKSDKVGQLTLKLFQGQIYHEITQNLSYEARLGQPYRIIDFDTLYQHIDVSSILPKNLETENYEDNYQMLNAAQLLTRIDTLKQQNNIYFKRIDSVYSQKMGLGLYNGFLSKKEKKDVKIKNLESLHKQEQEHVLRGALYKAKENLSQLEAEREQIDWVLSEYYSHIMEFHYKFSFAFACLVMFFIGAPLGSIIRKGGMGLPFVMAILIFILFYVTLTLGFNMANKGDMNPILGAWIQDLLLFPLGLYLTYKALSDSSVFNLETYTDFITRFFRFKRNKT